MKWEAVAIVFAVALVVTNANAECPASGPSVAVRGEEVAPELRSAIVEQLRASLAERKIALCSGGEDGVAAATLDLSAPDATRVAMKLTVRDAITRKDVSRELDLSRVPSDAHALVIAQAADELLRASWAELLLTDAPPPSRPVPQEITRAVTPPDVTPTPAPAPASSARLGVGVGAERFVGGHAQIGPEADVAFMPWPRLGVHARFGYRFGAERSGPKHVVDSTAIVAGGGAIVTLVRSADRLTLDATAEILLTHAWFDARPHDGVAVRNEDGAAVHAVLGASGWMLIARGIGVRVGAFGGAPLKTVRVTDQGQTLTAVSGAIFGAAVAIEGRFGW